MIDWTNPIFSIPLLTGTVYIVMGIIMLKFPPKAINTHYGYRTKRSIQSQESWDFAQRFSSKRMMWSGVLLMLTSALAFIIHTTELLSVVIPLSIVIAAGVIPIVITEVELKSRFKAKTGH